MKRMLVSTMIAVCCSAFAGNALAEGPRHHHPGPTPPHQMHKHKGDLHKGKHDYRPGHHKKGGPPPHAWRHPAPPRVAHHHHWTRGDRLPRVYLAPRYIVEDWHVHRFSPPPPGHRWVRVGTDYFLVGLATGVILQAVLSR